MSQKLVLNIDDKLYAKLEKHARKNGESVPEFFVKAACDALDMWDDFYDCTDMDNKDARPQVSFFANT